MWDWCFYSDNVRANQCNNPNCRQNCDQIRDRWVELMPLTKPLILLGAVFDVQQAERFRFSGFICDIQLYKQDNNCETISPDLENITPLYLSCCVC